MLRTLSTLIHDLFCRLALPTILGASLRPKKVHARRSTRSSCFGIAKKTKMRIQRTKLLYLLFFKLKRKDFHIKKLINKTTY